MIKNQFAMFVLVSGFAALVNVVSRYMFSSFVKFEIAIVLAYLIGILTAYGLNRVLVFEPSGRSAYSELGRFTIVNLFALVLVWVVSVGLARIVFPYIGFTWHSDDIAHVIGVASPAVTSFLAHRHYTFRADRLKR